MEWSPAIAQRGRKDLPLTNIGYCPAERTAGYAMAVVFVEPASYIKNKRKHANQLVSLISKTSGAPMKTLLSSELTQWRSDIFRNFLKKIWTP